MSDAFGLKRTKKSTAIGITIVEGSRLFCHPPSDTFDLSGLRNAMENANMKTSESVSVTRRRTSVYDIKFVYLGKV